MVEYSLSDIVSSPVAEGVRFQLGATTTIAVRRESKDIALRIRRERHPVRRALRRVPFLSGMTRLIGSVAGFMDALSESAELEPQRVIAQSRVARRFCELFRVHPLTLAAMGNGVLIVLLLLALGLAFPMAVERLLIPELMLTRLQSNILVCATRVGGLLIAMAIIPHLKVMKRLCMYRGAINKVLNAYGESGRHITADAAQSASIVCRQSDAAFVAAVILTSVIVFACVRTYTLPVQLVVRLLIVLLVAGVLNEPIRLLEDASPESSAYNLLAPQMLLERLFVAEPHRQMLAVAVYAFNAARENDY